MALRWEDERYVRLYTRDTVDWLGLGWEAQSLFMLMLRKVDRAGVLELGKSSMRGLARFVGMPVEVVERSLPLLLEDGCVEQSGTTLIIPNFIEAQESIKSPAARQKESRLKRRDMIRAGMDPSQRETVIYFIQSEHGGPIKIGRADDLAKRLVGLQTSRPDKLVVLAAAPGTLSQERQIHDHFADLRQKGEWFTEAESLMIFVHDVASRGTQAIADVVQSRAVTRHETRAVTPFLSVPNLSEPNLTKPSIKPADSASRNGAHPIPDGLPIQQSEPKPAKQQTGKKPPKQPSGTNEAIAFYCEQWVAVRCPIDGKAPKLGAADIKAAVSLVRDYGLDSAKAFIERFIADADKFLVERGHMLRDIGQRVNGYRATAGPQRRFKNVEVACEPYAEGEGGVQDL